MSSHTGIPVCTDWDRPAGRYRPWAWLAEWVDEPTTHMREPVAEHAHDAACPVDITRLRYLRHHRHTAWSAALIAVAQRGELPGDTREAIALAEWDLIENDATGVDGDLVNRDRTRRGHYHRPSAAQHRRKWMLSGT